jgi:hypothetical protein
MMTPTFGTLFAESIASADVRATVGRFNAAIARILINATVELRRSRAIEPPAFSGRSAPQIALTGALVDRDQH